MGIVFSLGVTSVFFLQPSATYSWVWDQVKNTSQEFIVGLLDISQSFFGDEWQVIEGGNQTIDLSGMIPGDRRQLNAVLSRGESDLDIICKIVAELQNSSEKDSAEKLAEVLRIRVERDGTEVFDGLVRELTPLRHGSVPQVNPTEERMSVGAKDRQFAIQIYLPADGVDASYHGVTAQLELRFLARQATPGAIYAE
jgi:hypothetical protein